MIDEPIDSIDRAPSGVENSKISMRHTAKVGWQQLPILTKCAPSEPFLFVWLVLLTAPSAPLGIPRC